MTGEVQRRSSGVKEDNLPGFAGNKFQKSFQKEGKKKVLFPDDNVANYSGELSSLFSHILHAVTRGRMSESLRNLLPRNGERRHQQDV